MSFVSIAYANTSIAIQPFDNENPNRRLFMDDIAEQFVWWDDVNGVELFRIGGSGGGSVGFHSVTYAQLTTLIGGNSLIKGDFYLINDFATKYTIPNTAVVNTGVLEPIFMQASSVNTLNQNAISTLFPQDIITYEVVDSTTAGGDKGRISFRKDTVNNNSTYYDWRNVQFRRWETVPASGIFTVLTNNGGAFNDYYTFNNSATASGCKNNSLGAITPTNPKGITDGLNNTLFQCRAEGNSFDINCVQNTFFALPFFISQCLFNTVGENFSGNVIGALIASVAFFKNTIGNSFMDNTIGYNFAFNTIGTAFSSNQIGNLFEFNTTYEGFSSNTIGNNFQYNKCGNVFDFNIIGNFAVNNVLGDNFESNTITNNFSDNITGNNFQGNGISDDFKRNKIGYGFISNPTIGITFQDNMIENNFTNNSIGANCTGNSIGNDFSTNTFGVNLINNIFGNTVSNNSAGDNFIGNEIRNGFSTNTIGIDFSENEIKNNFSNNIISDTFQNNFILDSFNSNNIGLTFLYNQIGNLFQNNTIVDGFQDNIIKDNFGFNSITNGFNLNRISSLFSNNTIVANFQNNTIAPNLNLVDFTLATFVYNSYTKEIFQNSAGTFRLKYTDNADVIQYVAPNA